LANQENDTAAWQGRECAARERVATRFDIERMVESYRSVWRRVQLGAPFMTSEQDLEG